MGSLLNILMQGGKAAYPYLRGALGFTGRNTTAGNLQNIGMGSLYTGGAAKYGIDNWTAQGRDKYDKSRSPDSAGTAAPAQTMDAFQKSMAKSVTTAATEEDDEEENPFNYNQLFIASILKGLKQKPPATAGGRASGTYIPKPELPRMSDYDSNKTYWNIG